MVSLKYGSGSGGNFVGDLSSHMIGTIIVWQRKYWLYQNS